MRLPEAIHQRAALAATALGLIALSPFFYPQSFPPLPLALTMPTWFGLPGFFIAKWLGVGLIEKLEIKLFLIVAIDWIFYFVLFAGFFYFRAHRKETLPLSIVLTENKYKDHE